jgi:putative RecB family exonuclease
VARAEEPSQLGFDDMPTRLVKVTPSKLSTWGSCRRRYRMTYLDRPAPPRGGAWAHSTLGAVVHAALRSFYDTAPQRRTVGAARAAVATAWSGEGFADAAQQARYRERAQDWVARYVAENDPTQVEAVGLERWVSAPVGVVDYKTGRRPLTEHDARSSQALALYVLASRRTLRRPCRRVELHHLPTGEVHGFDHTAESLARQLARAEEQAAEIALHTDTLAAGADGDELFPASPGAQCSWCDLRRSCPEGRAAAPGLDPWAGLAP